MYRVCSKCGKIHDTRYRCTVDNRTYQDTKERKLRSKYAWTRKSKQIRDEANHLCEVCRREGIYTYDNLEVHHITKIKDDDSLLLDDGNLICLCEYHHKLADDGKLDKDYLRSLALERMGKG
jgi:5-methylcytosine-specific restriction endonuclease McrA